LHSRPNIDHRYEFNEFRVQDRADYWLRACFSRQRAAAKQRGIPFAMTFEEWLKVCQDSGRLRERGTMSGNYQMGRRGDVGGYASSNVEIVSLEENRRQAAANRKAGQALTAASSDWVTASSTAAVPW